MEKQREKKGVILLEKQREKRSDMDGKVEGKRSDISGTVVEKSSGWKIQRKKEEVIWKEK